VALIDHFYSVLRTERWQTLAVEARSAADELTDPEAKRIMLSIADGYEVLARRAEARKKDHKVCDTSHHATALGRERELGHATGCSILDESAIHTERSGTLATAS
jgi:hypothetical protein